MKQPVDAASHVFVLYEFAPVGLLNAPVHAGDEAGLIFEHTGRGVFHQLLGVLAIGNRQSLEAGFNVRLKMHFRAFQGTRKPACRLTATSRKKLA
ncbi:MAG: hypothetical protein ACLQKA_05405 [Bryobacteraceae bacterium]